MGALTFASISEAELHEREPYPIMTGNPRNKILVRFRQYIAGERLSSADVAFFLSHAKSWWLLTSNEAEREHAQRVLARLGMALMKIEDEEAAHG